MYLFFFWAQDVIKLQAGISCTLMSDLQFHWNTGKKIFISSSFDEKKVHLKIKNNTVDGGPTWDAALSGHQQELGVELR